MSQILCWAYEFQPDKFPESTVSCKDKNQITNYLTQTSIIIFNDLVLKNRENYLFLLLTKLSMPNTNLIHINGSSNNNIFEDVCENDLNQYLQKLLSKTFQIENKKANIDQVLRLIHKLF